MTSVERPVAAQPRLLARDAERHALRTLVERGGVTVVHGPAGIGKSALLSSAGAEAAECGRTVLATAGVWAEASMPFAALERLLRPRLDAIDTLPAPQRDALLAALGRSEAPVSDVFLVGLATLTLLSDAEAVVIVDDAHWLDAASGDVLAFVARRLQVEPVALLVGVRDGDDGALSNAVRAEGRAIALAPLDTTSARALLDEAAPALSPAARREVLAAAAGNPLALVELPRTASASGVLSERLERSFTAQLDELDPAARAVLLVAAADDGDAATEILQAARRLAPDAAEDAAVGARLLERDGAALRFRHPLVRSAVLQAAGEPDRREAHAALAAVIADAPHRRAWHQAAARTEPDDAVAGALDAAADDARRRGAAAEGRRALERAAELSSDRAGATRRLIAAAELAVQLGDLDAVTRLTERVEWLDPGPLARAHLRGIRETFADDATEDDAPVRALVGDAEVARAAGDADLALRLLLAAGTRCWWALPADAPVRGAVVDAALSAGVDGDDPRVIAVLAATSAVEHAALVIERLERACAVPRDDDPVGAHLLGQAAHMVGHAELAVRQLARVEAQWRAQGRLALLAQALVMRAWSSIQLGTWPAVEPAAAEGDRLARETDQPLWAAGARAALAAVAGVRGEHERAGVLAAEVEAQLVGDRPTNVLACLQVARGVAALGAERYAEADEQLARLFDPTDPSHHYAEQDQGIGYVAEAAPHCGRIPAARALVERFEPVAARNPATLLQVNIGVARPLVAPSDDAFATALAGPAGRHAFHRARLLLAQGGWLRRGRRAAESRAPLRTARDLFDALGARPWAERARLELRASGETSRRRADTARDELSPQELQIALLAAEGLSNPEIGERLFLSPRTVQSHLYRAFPKLGITSRRELTGALGIQPPG